MKRPVSLHIYRGHIKSCAHRSKRRKHTKCDCPVWVDGTDENGQRIMCSLHTRSWPAGQKFVRDVEARGYVHEQATTASPEARPNITLEEARQKFVDAQKGHLGRDRIKRYERLFRRMQEFIVRRNLDSLIDLNLEMLTEFLVDGSGKWHQRASTVCLNIQMLRRFFGFCQKREWVKGNPAKELEMPKSKRRPTLPFSTEEWRRILAAFPLYAKRAGPAAARRLHGFVLLLRYSGMRIGDATRCETSWIEGNLISFETQKTNVHVRNQLPEGVIQILKALPLKNGKYFFWTGASTLHSAVGKWQHRLRTLFDLAGVRDGHAHRFRDSYAHDLTHNGKVTLEELKQALGHQNTRTTEKYYLHWIDERQARLESKQELAWVQSPALQALDGKEETIN